uniref:hypothetical protein n=1 Tax=Pseudomonas sp. EL_65y_Pfl1_R83 TaxID=3088697 RepID=UPI0030DB5100
LGEGVGVAGSPGDATGGVVLLCCGWAEQAVVATKAITRGRRDDSMNTLRFFKSTTVVPPELFRHATA